ncbi:MAG: DUF1553 domain-containing protein [Chthoniobacteraceae bacterium]
MITAVRHADEDLKMPKEKLAEHEIDALREWVRMGAPDPRSGEPPKERPSSYDWAKERQHWAYQPIRDPQPPEVQDAAWPKNDVDRFIRAKLDEKQLSPVGDADRRTLLRRVTYDLTGLPPTPEAMASFLADESPEAFEKVIDGLLASRHYGERWARHWMDLVRYADTAGDNSDYPIPQLYLYRSFLIDAFNEDRPFDRFLKEQLAGDLLPARDQAERNRNVIATGYVALSRRFGSVIDRYPQHLTIEDTIDNLGRTFLGLTISCARCHDHKFDAITQKDYYALYGMFESTKYAFPGIELLKIQKDFVPLVSKEEEEAAFAPLREKEKELQAKHDALAKERKELEAQKAELEKSMEGLNGEERAGKDKELATLHQTIEKVRGQIRDAAGRVERQEKKRPKLPDAYAVQDGKPEDAKIHLKGEPKNQGDAVPRRWLELFGATPLPEDVAKKSSGRLQLAEWIADRANPLTARVIVNRIWHYHFGAGLVRTPSDFGVRGQAPDHPELLDWLATRFVEDGWSMKKLHKRILLSRTYQLASTDVTQNIAVDPDNQWHWRFDRRRLDAESLRDTLLTLSGSLDSAPLNEPHPFPPPDKWEFTQHHPFADTYPTNKRSVYLMTARLNAQPFFQTFDGPDRNASAAVRDSSVTTAQALYFMNDEFVHEQAEKFADRVLKEASDDRARIERAVTLVLHRPVKDEERERLESFLTQAREKLAAEDLPEDKRERTAWAGVARVLFRTNEFLYLD